MKQKGHPTKEELIDWDAVPLGSKMDKELAQDLGVSPPAVRKQRVKRGISAFVRETWDKSMLGKVPDRVLARMVGITASSVTEQRQRRGIPAASLKCITTEGERAHYGEAVIDLYWHAKQIPHRFQYRVGRYIADWLINQNTLVEYAGFLRSKAYGAKYQERLDRKVAFYRESGYDVLVITEQELLSYITSQVPDFTQSQTCSDCGQYAMPLRKGRCIKCYRQTTVGTILPRNGNAHCLKCNRAFGSKGQKRGIVRHAGDGLCHQCYTARRKTQ